MVRSGREKARARLVWGEGGRESKGLPCIMSSSEGGEGPLKKIVK